MGETQRKVYLVALVTHSLNLDDVLVTLDEVKARQHYQGLMQGQGFDLEKGSEPEFLIEAEDFNILFKAYDLE